MKSYVCVVALFVGLAGCGTTPELEVEFERSVALVLQGDFLDLYGSIELAIQGETEKITFDGNRRFSCESPAVRLPRGKFAFEAESALRFAWKGLLDTEAIEDCLVLSFDVETMWSGIQVISTSGWGKQRCLPVEIWVDDRESNERWLAGVIEEVWDPTEEVWGSVGMIDEMRIAIEAASVGKAAVVAGGLNGLAYSLEQVSHGTLCGGGGGVGFIEPMGMGWSHSSAGG